MKKAIFGFGGHAREVAKQIGEDITFFVTDEYSNQIAKPISKFDPTEYEMMIAVANSKDRQEIVKLLPSEIKFFTFIHHTALILDSNIEIGEGSFIGAYSVLTTNIKIGRHSILNRSNHIGHDCIIGDFFSAMPGSIVSGNCKIKNQVYLGTNVTIREKITICDSVIIGLSSGVVKNITVPGVYGGVPCKKIK
jgi:sugar O-acyltransferase (sialic acid O-acetyltransferase NeuD family)